MMGNQVTGIWSTSQAVWGSWAGTAARRAAAAASRRRSVSLAPRGARVVT